MSLAEIEHQTESLSLAELQELKFIIPKFDSCARSF